MAKETINQLIRKTGAKQYILAQEANITPTELTYIKKQLRTGAAYKAKEKRLIAACNKRLRRVA